MNRYLVSKGWEGFSDRLQCLSHCVTWALRYNRVLHVDWEDRIWSHGNGGFHRYFDLVDLPYVSSVAQIPAGLDVFPSFWQRGMGLPADEWIYKLKDELIFDPQEGRHYESVWVHPGIGFRAYDFAQLPLHLRLSAAAATEIKPLLAVAPSNLPVVHLRGTDRPLSEERWAVLRQIAPVACVVSDDQSLVRRWLQESPESVVLSDTLVESQGGGHKLDPKSLGKVGLDKHRMNIRLLTDFIVLAGAKEAHALNEQSIFFSMARMFGACGGVPALFESVPAPTKVDNVLIRVTQSVAHPHRTNPAFVEPPPGAARRLHVGGKVRMANWEIINAVPGDAVDHVGNAKDLSRFADGTFQAIYASHVLEHFDFSGEILHTLKEWNRVLEPGGKLMVSVPDLDVLAKLFIDKSHFSTAERFYVMQMMFGGHVDRYDYHLAGVNQEFLAGWLAQAGFVNVRRVENFGLTNDTSSYLFKGHAVSLNVTAEKGHAGKIPS
jgi:predicted SAM-dependent methyltransferase